MCGGLDCEVKEGFAASFVIEVRAPEGSKVKVGDASGRERSCGTHVGPSGEKASFGVTMFDNEVAAFDRRTGKKLAERAFPAPPGQCPSNISRSVGGLSQTSEVSWEVRSDFAKKFIE